MLTKFLRRLIHPKTHAAPRHGHQARPTLEMLETRLCPADFYWSPLLGGTTDWSYTNAQSQTNWVNSNKTRQTVLPQSTDTAHFDGTYSNSSVQVSSTTTVGALVTANNYTGTIQILNGTTLQMTSGTLASALQDGTNVQFSAMTSVLPGQKLDNGFCELHWYCSPEF
jgi:hypothetical protein